MSGQRMVNAVRPNDLSLPIGRRLLNRAQWTLFALTALLAAIYVAWLALAQVNFLYPLWHDLIGIDRTIQIYGPQNRYRDGFAATSKAERGRLFAAIVQAIHNQGAGLDNLVYHDARGRPLGKLLRESEILHLRDVALLVDALIPVGLGALITSIALLLIARLRRLSMPSFVSLLSGVAVAVAAIASLVLIIGPLNVFYWLHTLVFPPDHQWFFYYQDSLMSTMMQAPDLFGCIALAWALVSLLLLTGFLLVTRAWLDRKPAPH